MIRALSLLGLLAASAAHAQNAPTMLLRQPNGSYQPVTPAPSATPPYTSPSPYDGASWAPVYDAQGKRVGTVTTDAGGTRFYDNNGRRK